MPEPNEKTVKKDNWDKLNIILKGVLVILIPAAIAFYGIWTEKKRSSEAEENRAIQVLIQSLANRQAVTADMKAKMFDTLLTLLVNEKDNNKRILYLELLAMNFREQLQFRPIFEKLYAELDTSTQKKDLNRIVKDISSREISTIIGSGGEVCGIELTQNQEVDAGCNTPLSIKLHEVYANSVLVSVIPKGESSTENQRPFEINYFDTPFADNSKINELHYSLILSSNDDHQRSARLRIVVFPRHFYSAENRLQLDQLMGKYLESNILN